MVDVLIVGGGVAGLSAAMYLGRFRHKVMVVDSQKPANRFTHAAHNFFSRDGIAPSELLTIGREQLRPYETVQIHSGDVRQIVPDDGQFAVTLNDGSHFMTQKVLLASGMKDTLPPVAGIEPFWGRSVFHCPYCDGWEQRDQPVAIYANGDGAVHLAKLLRVLTADVVICTDGAATFDARVADSLRAHGIQIIETPVERFEGQETQVERIVFADGTTLPRKAIFVRPITSQHSDFAAQLGCEMTENGLVKIDMLGRTTTKGVYAAGDMASPVRQLIVAAMQGGMAGVGINVDLVEEMYD